MSLDLSACAPNAPRATAANRKTAAPPSARRAFIGRGESARAPSTAADGRDGRQLVVRREHPAAGSRSNWPLTVNTRIVCGCDPQCAQHVVDRRAVGHVERAPGGVLALSIPMSFRRICMEGTAGPGKSQRVSARTAAEGHCAPPRGAANEVSVGVVHLPARPPEGHCAPPRGAANEVSVGARSSARPAARRALCAPSGAANEVSVGVVHPQRLATNTACAALAGTFGSAAPK